MSGASLLPATGASFGPSDEAALQRLANAFFSALPGQVPDVAGAGSPASLPAATGAIGPSAAPAAFGGVQAPADPTPPGFSAGPFGNGPQLPGTLVPGGNALPTSPQDVASSADAQPARLPKAQAGNGVPDVVHTAAPALDGRYGGAALGEPRAAVPGRPSAHGAPLGAAADPASPFYFIAEGLGQPHGGSELRPIDHGRVERAFELPGTDELKALLVDAPPRCTGPLSFDAPAPPSRGAVLPHAPISPHVYYFNDHAHASDTPGAGHAVPQASQAAHPAFDVHAIRRDFPILREQVNGRPLAWFDNAATTQKPQSVIDRLALFYAHENSNIHRAAHELAARATDAYEGARKKVAAFIGAPSVDEIIFVRGTTEGINLVAVSWGGKHIGAGDEIIVSHLEHHANIVPWQMLAAEKGAKLRVIPVDDSGQVLLEEYKRLLSDRTKLVSVTQVSNALGTVVPVQEIVELAHRAGAKALVDGAQSVSHMRVDVRAIGADFFVFSGHKVFGPTGIGVVWGKSELLEDMPPYQGGGNMIQDVTFERTVYHAPPARFEAGTGNIADAVGLGAAIDYVERIGLENIGRYEHELLDYATEHMRGIPGVRLVGTARDKASVLSFVLAGHTTQEVGEALNDEGIAVRTGHHCAQPILRRFGLETTVRPSLAFYNTRKEVDRMVRVVQRLSRGRR